jgi:SAM-dependent methyltransferase
MSNTASRWADREFLRDQYRTDENLRARQSIYAFQQPCIDLPAVSVNLLATSGNETVADVGCGNGRYLSELRKRGHAGTVIGLDMSVGMLRAAGAQTAGAQKVGALLAQADAAALPLRSGSAELALAMHMLYHVPDPSLAVHELRRVTAAGGQVLVGLNGADHLRELRAAVAAGGRDVGLDMEAPGERLSLSDGEELMRTVFQSVARHDFEAELVVTERGPIEGYVRSTISLTFVPAARQPDYVASVLRHLDVNGTGEFRIKTHCGCLICS